MSDTTQVEQEQQEADDASRVCRALRRVLDERDISTYELEEMTGIPNSTLRRMADRQEPKGSTIARIERVIGVRLGTVARMAELIETEDIEALLATDPKLHPTLRQSYVLHYRSDVALSSSDGSKRSARKSS